MAAMAVIIGAAGLRWYVWDIIIGEAEVADRSMLFWGLPIVFLSLAALGAAVGLIVLARRLLRTP